MKNRLLYSVVGGPCLAMLKASASSGQKVHFVCSDDNGRLDEFDLNIIGVLREDGEEHRLLFTARDTLGLVWNVAYDTLEESGNMFRNVQGS